MVERPTEKPGSNTDAGSSPQCRKGFVSQSQLPVRTLLRCSYSPRVQSHASTSVRALKTPKHWQLWLGHTKTLHTLIGMGSAALAAAVPYPGKFPARDKEILKKYPQKPPHAKARPNLRDLSPGCRSDKSCRNNIFAA